MKMMGVLVALLAGASATTYAAQSGPAAVVGTSIDVRAGERLAADQCRTCHDRAGDGGRESTPHLAGQRERYLRHVLEAYATGARRHAVASEWTTKLTGADRANLAAYYARAKPTRLAPAAASMPAAVRECERCHGAGGNSTTPGVPSLAGQQARYLLAALHQYQSGERVSAATKAMAMHREEADLEALSRYFAGQPARARAVSAHRDVGAGQAASAACAACHGEDGASRDASIPHLAAQDERYLIAAIKAYRDKSGHWGMQHQVIALTDEQARAVAAFFAAQPPAATTSAAAPTRVTAACDRCHDSDNPSVPTPKLRGQPQAYLATTLREYRDGAHAHSTMHKMLAADDDALLDRIAAAYASLPPD